MKEKNENKLDQLFKDGLSGPGDHFAFREEDWDSMEQLLDKKSGKKAGFVRIMYYASGIAALLLLAAGLYFYTNTDKTDPLITKNTKIQAQADSGQTSIRQAEKPAVPVESLSATAPKKTAPTQTVITPVVSNPLNPALARVQHGRKTIDDTIYANPQRLASTNHVRLNTRKKDTRKQKNKWQLLRHQQ
jgi:cytoskeletal protein RodZ